MLTLVGNLDSDQRHFDVRFRSRLCENAKPSLGLDKN